MKFSSMIAEKAGYDKGLLGIRDYVLRVFGTLMAVVTRHTPSESGAPQQDGVATTKNTKSTKEVQK